MRFKTIAISGSGSGLGEALAYRFAKGGYRVAVSDVDPQRAQKVFENIQQQGGDGFAMGLDVTSESDWQALYQRVSDEWGGLDVLVNNAGVAAAGRLEDSSIEDWNWVLDIDLMGVIRGCHRFVPLFRSQRGGHIVNVASFAGMMPVPALSAYATAKAGVVALSEQLRVDLVGSGVGVSVLCPAFVDTRLLETLRSNDDKAKKMASKWMSNSPITAEKVAEDVFKAVKEDRFLILTHPATRWVWRFRRWFPEQFHRRLVKIAKSYRRKLRT
jgi:NAD(P)-dependent dehydrogenase (short-subunit alcohol dehydrogenase family)